MNNSGEIKLNTYIITAVLHFVFYTSAHISTLTFRFTSNVRLRSRER